MLAENLPATGLSPLKKNKGTNPPAVQLSALQLFPAFCPRQVPASEAERRDTSTVSPLPKTKNEGTNPPSSQLASAQPLPHRCPSWTAPGRLRLLAVGGRDRPPSAVFAQQVSDLVAKNEGTNPPICQLAFPSITSAPFAKAWETAPRLDHAKWPTASGRRGPGPASLLGSHAAGCGHLYEK